MIVSIHHMGEGRCVIKIEKENVQHQLDAFNAIVNVVMIVINSVHANYQITVIPIV